MKKKFYYIIMILIIIVIALISVVYYINNNENDDKKEAKDNNIDITITDETTTVDEKSMIMFQKLDEYGEEIYNSNKYNNLNKKNDVYFASLDTLNKEFGYDISMFVGEDGTVCNIYNTGIYFDIDSKMNVEYVDSSLPIVTVLIGCSEEYKID